MVEPNAPYGPVPAEKAGNALINSIAAKTENRLTIFFIYAPSFARSFIFLCLNYSSLHNKSK